MEAFVPCGSTIITRGCLRCHVAVWLDGIIDTSTLEDSQHMSPLDDQNSAEMTDKPSTPPPLSNWRSTSPSKRQRAVDDSQPAFSESTMQHMTIPSLSQRFNTGSQGVRTRRRTASPTKRPVDLLTLVKPVDIKASVINNLPDVIKGLHSEIMRVSYCVGIVPSEVQTSIKKYGHDFPAHLFAAPRSPDHDEPDVLHDPTIELVMLDRIHKDALRLDQERGSEAAWGVEVYGPLLKFATGLNPGVLGQNITTAAICKDWLPLPRVGSWNYDAQSMFESTYTSSTGGGSGHEAHTSPSVAAGKMVDFALLMETEGTPLSATIKYAIGGMDNPMHRTINHSMYGPLVMRPLGVSIETKAAGAAGARLKLALWTAAWFYRLEAWMSMARSKNPGVPILPMLEAVPALMVVGHDWRLSYFVNRGDRFEFGGDIPVGSTATLGGIYQVLAVLKILVRWVDVEHRAWFEELFRLT